MLLAFHLIYCPQLAAPMLHSLSADSQASLKSNSMRLPPSFILYSACVAFSILIVKWTSCVKFVMCFDLHSSISFWHSLGLHSVPTKLKVYNTHPCAPVYSATVLRAATHVRIRLSEPCFLWYLCMCCWQCSSPRLGGVVVAVCFLIHEIYSLLTFHMVVFQHPRHNSTAQILLRFLYH